MDEWKTSEERYSESQVISVLSSIGVMVVSETYTNFLCLCPFHGNDNTPALSISKKSGLFMCFNPSCGETGNLVKLVMEIANIKQFPALRLISQYKTSSKGDLSKEIAKLLDKDKELKQFDQSILNNMYDNFWEYGPAQEYMHKRGFNDQTLEHFKVGYSYKKNLVAVPMHDKKGNPVGVIGRSIVGKSFDNSKGLPTSRTLFNLHRAMRAGDKVIVVEASFSAMKFHQIGYPCVVALCMGTLSPYHIDLLDMYFDGIIIATDFDDHNQYIKEDCRKCAGECKGHNPGRALGEKIAKELKHKQIKWASYSDGIIYPNGAKDPDELSDEDAKKTIVNSVSDFQYRRWKREFPNLAIV